MKPQINPFVYGKPVPPTHFIGREDIINHCYNRLAGPVRSSIAISGEHGLGKTSLLYYLRHTAQKEQWGQPYTHNIFIYLYCPTLEQFTANRFWRRVLERIKQEKDNPALHQRIDQLLGQEEIEVTHFRRFLRWLNQWGFSLVLLLDGFTWIVKTDTADQAAIGDFLSHLRALTNDPDYSLILLTATRKRLNILCYDIVQDRPESEFYNGFIFQSLPPFTPDEIDALLKQALKEANFEFDQADRGLLHHMAGAHPALLQMAGYLLFEERRHAPLTGKIYKKVIEDFEREARHYFSLFWNESSPLEQTLLILTILSHLSGESSLQFDMTGEEIQGLLQKYERDMVHLVERSLIQQVEDTYQIFSAVFAWCIVREMAAESETMLADRYQTIGEEPLRRVWRTIKKLAPQLTLDRLTQTLVMRPSLPAATTPIPPRYKLQEEVGRGASSVVYKAFDTHLDRTVAIKLLHSHLATPMADRRRRLLKEARAASQLQHSHIVTIHDVAEVGDHIFLVMEYLEGQSVADLLRKEGPLPLKQVIALIGQAAAALDYAHAQGVIHRDIKPANLIVTTEGALKLTDFGIAKRTGDPQTTERNEFKGTVIYMSPEQINQQSLDGRSDLFALAVVTFEMLSGASPWPGSESSDFALMTHITNDASLSLADFDVPGAAHLDPIFQKALAKNPTDRYQRGEDFVQALKQASHNIS